MFEIVNLATKITSFGPTKSKHWNANKTKSMYLNPFKFFDYIFLKCFFIKKKQKNHSKHFFTNEIHDHLFSATVCNLRCVSSLQFIIKFLIDFKTAVKLKTTLNNKNFNCCYSVKETDSNVVLSKKVLNRSA